MSHFSFLLNFSSTWFLVGLIWLIQIVHYPLFKHVGKETFQVYHDGHSIMITPVVGTVMIIELMSSVLMVFLPPRNIPLMLPITGVILVFIIWVSTFFLQIPYHHILSKAYEPEAQNLLVQTNWVRTIVWTVRGILLFYMLHIVIIQKENISR